MGALLLFGKIGTKRQCTEREKEYGFKPVLLLNSFYECNAEKDDEYGYIRKRCLLHTVSILLPK